ncbi:ABC transporter related protein (modular protein) [Paraburkholderia piptadeniae]|uniref:ABC transporter related protein (Modular protein) n=1 Tax=Paraburkholderia piptadeniae TaxID=1701573 RepID=A0A1N7S042_9BURK|nr:ABC transporter ATP-binding protein [Paraburkholderia piptadeniae]SIT40752.1 ABC transporter related protein (modular protein) [Paraburkholderia piptadeniae]
MFKPLFLKTAWRAVSASAGAVGPVGLSSGAAQRAGDAAGAASVAGNALTVQDLVIGYGGKPVVNGVNFTIGHGEFVTLLGPSGSGKTSVLRAVAGYVQPEAGDIRIGARSMIGVSPRLRNCGMVFQSYALFPHMTLFQNIAYGLKTRGVAQAELQERVAEIVDAMHLGGFEGRYPHEMSGGQQQRVALARALVVRPDLLLMDEPLAALDLRLREQMQVEIRRIQQQFNISTLYITHDQGEAFTMSDRIMVMNRGDIVSSDRPRQVYLAPNCSFTARFVGSSSLMEIPLDEARAQSIALPGQAARFALDRPLPAEVGHLFVSLRPEVVQVRADAAPGWSEGVVVSRRFAGMSLMVSIRAGKHEVLAVDPSGEMVPDQPVWIRWALAEAHVIAENTGGLPCKGVPLRLVPLECGVEPNRQGAGHA